MVEPTDDEFKAMMEAITAYGDARADLALKGVVQITTDMPTEVFAQVREEALRVGRSMAAVRDAIGGKVVVGGKTYRHGKRIA